MGVVLLCCPATPAPPSRLWPDQMPELQPHAGGAGAVRREARGSRSSRFDPIRSNSTHKRERDRGILTQSGNVPFHISVPYKHAAPCHPSAPGGTPASPRTTTRAGKPSAGSIPPSATRIPARPPRSSHEQSRPRAALSSPAGAPRAGRCGAARQAAGTAGPREQPRPRRPLTRAGLGVVVAAVEGAGTRLVAVAGPVGAVGPPAGAQAGRAAAGAAQPAGGAAGGGAAGQGRQHQQRQQGGPTRHGASADLRSPQPGPVCRLKGAGSGRRRGGRSRPASPAPWPRRGKAAGRSPGAASADGGESPAGVPARSVSLSRADPPPSSPGSARAGARRGPGLYPEPDSGLTARAGRCTVNTLGFPDATVTFLSLRGISRCPSI